MIAVGKASPTITTQANPDTITVGTATMVGDIATFVGTTSVPPSGSVSFTLYSDSACTVSTGVSGAGGISTTTAGVSGAAFSMGWVAPATGTYYWRATYAGDVSNNGFTTPCGGPGELIVVGPGSPFITTQASPTSITVGTPTTVGDTATFENTTSVPPTGSVSFTLYSNDTCTTPAGVSGSASISTDTSGETTAAFSTTWTAPATGDYYWRASYAGDANNNAFTAGCNDANELIVVGPGSPSITTQASPMSMLVNTTLLVGDTATFQNTTSVAPTGSVSFTLYSDPTCTTSTGVSGSAMVLTSGGAVDRVVRRDVDGAGNGDVLLARELRGRCEQQRIHDRLR